MRWLLSCKLVKKNGYDTISVYDQFPGIDDDTVLEKASTENQILITSDKNFGEMIFKNKRKHSGINPTMKIPSEALH